MKAIECHLHINTLYPHIQQIYCGFSELQKNGLVRLKVSKTPDYKFDNPVPYVWTVINGKKVIYETHDSWEIPKEIRTDDIDFYFKRSFNESLQKDLNIFSKLYPLGLNYYVTSPNNFGTSNPFINYLGMVKDYESFFNRLRGKHQYRIPEFENEPGVNQEPVILFLARVWDPKGTKLEKKQEERFLINETRAKCVRFLRKNFGKSFIGGFSDDTYARANYADCIVSDSSVTKKTNYLKMMHSADICIATTGLHGSTGWKFAEYVAASKGIVSETLNYQVPGELNEGVNFLKFSTAEECLEKVNLLITNKDLLLRMMQANRRYYQNYVKPDSIVKNSLSVITGVKF